jgi:hypothetical protein
MSDYTYNVEWIGDYYNAATSVTIPIADEGTAIIKATRQMLDYYGWDMCDTATVGVSAELVNVEGVAA